MKRAAVGLVLAVLGTIALEGSQPASAVATPAAGYWVKLGIALPVVPKGGLLVGNDPTEAINPAQPPTLPIPLPIPIPALHLPGPQLFGYTAVSALRITGLPANVDVTLTLAVTPLSIPPLPSLGTIVACPIVAPWSPPSAGARDISTAPAGACDTPSVGRLASDDASMSFDLPASFQQTPGELDVLLQPGSTGLPLPFLVTFEPPSAAGVHAATGGAAPPTATVAPTPVVSTPSDVPDLAPLPSTAPEAISLPDVTPAPTALAAPATTTAPSTVLPQLPHVVGAAIRIIDDRGHRILAVGLLAGLAVGWWWLGTRRARPPHRLGALAASRPDTMLPEMGGIGRFRGPRLGPPPKI